MDNRLLRGSAWLDDSNLVVLEAVWLTDTGTKAAVRLRITPMEATALSMKLQHAATSGLRTAPRPKQA